MSRIRLLAVPVLTAALGTLMIQPVAAAPAAAITKAEYAKVKLGGSITALHTAAGKGACKLVFTHREDGHVSKSYDCKGDKPDSMGSFNFTDGRLGMKSYRGLDGLTSNGKMTKAKFDKTKKRQTLAQLTAVTGKGVCVLVSGFEIKSYKEDTYICTQSSSSGQAKFRMKNGELSTRSQYRLM
ncbi:hypothetical protein [Streptomyces sp. NBC_01244]|uniref:hypothetical protein n=1 Tax=Streptomyces sp. NBC_01244 TaxID=2903797 RepID=UPI002E1671A1|nr:hypothetical protein OG247_42185 [Streptomyces sp. NBC_01244]